MTMPTNHVQFVTYLVHSTSYHAAGVKRAPCVAWKSNSRAEIADFARLRRGLFDARYAACYLLPWLAFVPVGSALPQPIR